MFARPTRARSVAQGSQFLNILGGRKHSGRQRISKSLIYLDFDVFLRRVQASFGCGNRKNQRHLHVGPQSRFCPARAGGQQRGGFHGPFGNLEGDFGGHMEG